MVGIIQITVDLSTPYEFLIRKSLCILGYETEEQNRTTERTTRGHFQSVDREPCKSFWKYVGKEAEPKVEEAPQGVGRVDRNNGGTPNMNITLLSWMIEVYRWLVFYPQYVAFILYQLAT